VRNLCGGHCLAQNYHESKDLWAGYGFCEAALARGLFPSSMLVDADLADWVRDMDRVFSTSPDS
jgi:hypothetical protein